MRQHILIKRDPKGRFFKLFIGFEMTFQPVDTHEALTSLQTAFLTKRVLQGEDERSFIGKGRPAMWLIKN